MPLSPIHVGLGISRQATTGTRLESIYEVSSYSFFVWGFTLPKRLYRSFASYLRLRGGDQKAPIKLVIGKSEEELTEEMRR